MSSWIERQNPDGSWEGEMVWSTVILSQVVIVRHIVGFPFSKEDAAAALRYFRELRTPDRGWALHPEGETTVFPTTLAYVAQRLLGATAEELKPTRDWLHSQDGGVAANPSWGKFWLAILGLYDYRGMNPIPPEAFLLPEWSPIHPVRWYCHTRAIYLAMANLYGHRFQFELGELGVELRRELYGETLPRFSKYRHVISNRDLVHRPPWWLRRVYDLLAIYERIPIPPLRRRALRYCQKEIDYSQRTTEYQGISPINGLLNMVGQFHARPDDPEIAKGVEGIEHWRWRDERGLRYVGARSQPWDTAFALRALIADDPVKYAERIARGYAYLLKTQIVDELPNGAKHGRSITRGGWCFTDGGHRWPVSDCTAEALEAILSVHRARVPVAEWISQERIRAAVQFILSRQNPEGGFGSYEERRGHRLLQKWNPSELFARCMIEESYVECTGSSLSALANALNDRPELFGEDIPIAMDRGLKFLRRMQSPDGTWPAAWGLYHTYTAFFAVRALRAAKIPADDRALVRAADWLIANQRPDGAWGESYRSALEGKSVPHAYGQPAMTAWAVLALIEISGANGDVVDRGRDWLLANRGEEGNWPSGSVNGVFFGTSMLHYELYPQYFPAWAIHSH